MRKVTVRILVERDDGITCSGQSEFEDSDHEQPMTDAEVAVHVAAGVALHTMELLSHEHSAPGDVGLQH